VPVDARAGADGAAQHRGQGADRAPAARPMAASPQETKRLISQMAMDVRLGAVEQLEDRHVDVPDFVRASGADADSGFGGVNAKARAAPAALANEPGPCGRCGGDLADALGVEAQGAQGHMAVLGSEHHVLDGRDLGCGELAGRGSGTWGAIVEATDDGNAPPSVVARRRQAKDPQNQIEGQDGLGAGNRAQDPCLGLTLWKALAGVTETGRPQEREEKADGRGQDSRPSLQLLDGGQELLAVVAKSFERDNGAQAAELPTGDGRAGDEQSVVQRARAGAVHMFSQAVVVRSAVLRGRGEGRRCHRWRITERVSRASRRSLESSVISTMPQLRTRLCRMSWSAAGLPPAGRLARRSAIARPDVLGHRHRPHAARNVHGVRSPARLPGYRPWTPPSHDACPPGCRWPPLASVSERRAARLVTGAVTGRDRRRCC
jgi:hypothetical protein